MTVTEQYRLECKIRELEALVELLVQGFWNK